MDKFKIGDIVRREGTDLKLEVIELFSVHGKRYAMTVDVGTYSRTSRITAVSELVG